jgi:hypothetical protein
MAIGGRADGSSEFPIRGGSDRESERRAVAATFSGHGKIGKFSLRWIRKRKQQHTSALVPFAIDAANLRLILTPQLSLDFGNGAPVLRIEVGWH